VSPFSGLVDRIGSIVWGPYMLALFMGTGIYLTIGLRALQVTRLGFAVRSVLGLERARSARRDGERPDGGHARAGGGREEGKGSRGGQGGEEGEISAFGALTTALAATVGTGNLAGVATAIFLGGPGAVFWMWVTALFGTATKYSEALLAVRFRRRVRGGGFAGGPMYYIREGLGPRWRWLSYAFAGFASAAAFGIGNLVQANSVAQAARASLGAPVAATGAVLAALTAVVLLGGIRRISGLATKLVPFMAAVYVAGATAVILLNLDEVPEAFGLIVRGAFTGTAASGGFLGAGVGTALRMGVARGVFSNEAGLGSAPIAHAAARTDSPARQGTVAMLGTYIDTLFISSLTALVIIVSGAWRSGLTGAALSAHAFRVGLPGPGDFVVTLGLILFAFSTILAWSYYGERSVEYLLGRRALMPYRIAWTAAVAVGAVAELRVVWSIADVMNGLMAIPNLVALLALSGVVFSTTRGEFPEPSPSPRPWPRPRTNP